MPFDDRSSTLVASLRAQWHLVSQSRTPLEASKHEQEICRLCIAIHRSIEQEGEQLDLHELFPFLFALSIVPVPTTASQAAAAATLSKVVVCSTVASPTWDDIMAEHHVLRGLEASMFEHDQTDENLVAVAELFFVCVAASVHIQRELLCSEILRKLLEFAVVCRNASTVCYMLSILQLVVANNHEEASTIAIAFGAHHTLVSILEIQLPTIQAAALQILHLLTSQCPAAFVEMMSATVMVRLAVSLAESSWSEVAENACQWICLMLNRPEHSGFFSLQAVLRFDLHLHLLDLLLATCVSASCSAAMCIRSLLCHHPSLRVAERLAAEPKFLHSFSSIMLEKAQSSELGERILCSLIAQILALCSLYSTKARSCIVSSLHRHLSSATISKLRCASESAIFGVEMRSMQHWSIVDGTEHDITATTMLGSLEHESDVSLLFKLQAKREQQTREKSPKSNRHQGAVGDRSAALVPALLIAALHRVLKASSDTHEVLPVAGACVVTPSSAYKSCLMLCISLAHRYAPSNVPAKGIRPSKKNDWASPAPVGPQRTWSVHDLERADVFVFEVRMSSFQSDLQAAESDLHAHLSKLSQSLQVCSISNVRRRLLLNDLYDNVYPAVMMFLKYIGNTSAKHEHALSTLESYLTSTSNYQVVDSSNLQEIYHLLGNTFETS